MSEEIVPAGGVEVFIDESWERWTEFKLSDGTTLRAKVILNHIFRLPEHDVLGKPLYQPNFGIVAVVTDFPPSLGPTEH